MSASAGVMHKRMVGEGDAGGKRGFLKPSDAKEKQLIISSFTVHRDIVDKWQQAVIFGRVQD